MIALFAKLPYRFLMNVGDYIGEYSECAGQRAPGILVPAAGGHTARRPVHPSRRQQFSFNEALFFGKPAHDHAVLLGRTGQCRAHPRHRLWRPAAALRLDRRAALRHAIARLIADQPMKKRLAEVAKHMQAAKGTEKAAAHPRRDRDQGELQAVTDTLKSSAPHIYDPVSLQRPRGLGRAAELHRRRVEVERPPAVQGPEQRAGNGRVGGARPAPGRCRSRATSSAISSPAARPTGATTAR